MQMQYCDMLPDNLKVKAQEIVDLINKSKNILVSAHVRPDGDATGSVAGLVKSLKKLNKNVEVALHDPIPQRFKVAFPQVKIHNESEQNFDHELLIILDCGDFPRTGINFKPQNPNIKIINIDHHASNIGFGDVSYIDTTASATCEILTAILDFGKLPLDQDVALSFFLGLVTDSRFFQNEGVSQRTHLAAARILSTGVNTSPVLNALNSSREEADLRVQGFGLSNFKLECNNKLATLIITQEDLKTLGASFNNVYSSGIFNQMNAISSVIGTVVIFEKDKNCTHCEFRSRDGLNVKDVAVSMGGGGHVPASGCNKNESVEVVAKEAIEKMKKQVNEFLASKQS